MKSNILINWNFKRIQVLLFAAIFFLGKFAELHSLPVPNQREFYNVVNSKESSASNQEMSIEDDSSSISTNMSTTTLHPWLNLHKSEELLLYEGQIGEGHYNNVSCCPSETNKSAPLGGKNMKDEYVILYRKEAIEQIFYEVSCKADILNQPCRFMEKRFHSRSRCKQEYTYSYAIVKQTSNHFSPSFDSLSSSTDKYRLDYIQIRSGCSCEIEPNKKYKKVANKGKKKKRKLASNEPRVEPRV